MMKAMLSIMANNMNSTEKKNPMGKIKTVLRPSAIIMSNIWKFYSHILILGVTVRLKINNLFKDTN